MERKSVEQLKEIAKYLRKKVVTMIYEVQSGHPGGSLSAADFVTACYFREMNVDPKNPKWEDRDRFVLSKGHACPIQYAALETRGFFPEEVLYTLGQGLACAVSMAIGLKIDKKPSCVFAVLGDGECQEGEIWEAAQTANKYRLDNLIVFVDVNHLQVDGTTDEVMPNLDLGEKFKAFGFEIYSIDGNDMAQIVRTLDTIKMHSHNHKPKCIIGQTIKGKGVSYMENVGSWHCCAPNKEQWEQALKDIEEGF